MLGIRRSVRGQLALLGMVAVFAAQPCVAHAGWDAWNPVPFSGPLELSRGWLDPGMASFSRIPLPLGVATDGAGRAASLTSDSSTKTARPQRLQRGLGKPKGAQDHRPGASQKYRLAC